MSGRLAADTRALTVMLTTNTSHTAAQGNVRAWSVSSGSDPKAATAKMALSTGTLTALLTATRAHWYRLVTRRTNQWYTSVSSSSLTTSATIEATTIRHSGPRIARNSASSGYESSAGKRATHCR